MTERAGFGLSRALCGVWQREGSLTGFPLFKELSHEIVIIVSCYWSCFKDVNINKRHSHLLSSKVYVAL